MKFKIFLNHPLFKSSILYTLCDSINKAIPFIILPILSHYLLPKEYGIIANFGIFSSIIALIVGLVIEGAISVNFYKLNRNQLNIYITNAILLTIASAAIVLFIIIVLNKYISQLLEIGVDLQYFCLAMAICTTFTSVNLSLWRLEEKPVSFGIYEISNTAFNLLLSLLLVIVFSMGMYGRIYGIFVSTVVYGIFSLFFLYHRGYIDFSINKSYLKDILLFSLPLIPHALSLWVKSGIDRILITNFWDTKQVGLYATGFQFGMLVSFLAGAFNNAFWPYQLKLLSVEDENILNNNKLKLVKISYLVMICMSIMAVFFIFLSKFIIDYFYAKEYNDSKLFIYWAILSQLFHSFYLLAVNYIFLAKKTKQLAVITFSSSVLHLFLSYFCIKYFGAIGGAYSTFTISVLTFIAVFIYSKKSYKMPWFSYKNK